ncbi:capsular polysaccharide transport system permease protein [Roseomonas rosea]|uniref:Capsular polysaccharide transport system permease protein n=1 Tax=Muricoccus roseus TaxID=198092 RepID=A0A1M6G5W8_9PROT|nr:capsule biosynthesis protein [Roseomonas rosea]SHJ05388.1 capsular polysaccharide transport system permease protein [Roseomonas rosea]
MKVSPSIKAFDPAAPASGVSVPAQRRPSKLARTLKKWRGFLLMVALPTALTAVYFYGIAAGQYASEARFLVRGASGSGSAMNSALGSALGGAGFKPVQEEAMAVRDFLNSQEAVRELRQSMDIVSIWRRPEADLPAMLWEESPTVEALTRYYKRMVTADYDAESSAVSVQVRTFRAEDSKEVADALLRVAENLVNRLSERQRADTLGTAREEVAIAERRVIAAREAMTSFRQEQRAIDPASETAANVGAVTGMEGALAQARAELREKGAFMRYDNPQLGLVRNRIAALESQIANERQRLTSGEQSAPQTLAGYERLLLEREFSDRQLASAVASLEAARVNVARQQLYLAPVTQPHVAESAQYPKAAFAVGSVFAVLLVVYGIASLIFAGFREHAA